MRYTPTDCFETFPMPSDLESLRAIGCEYHAVRAATTLARKAGLTAVYNLVHDSHCADGDIRNVRSLIEGVDVLLARSYGWSDLSLGHDFHETKQGVRFTITEAARREVLARLLKLNHERYAEEVKQGLHDEGKKKGKGGKKGGGTPTGNSGPQGSLF
jgi:hypothetical protein